MLTQALTLAMPVMPGSKRDHTAAGQQKEDDFFLGLWETDPTLAIVA